MADEIERRFLPKDPNWRPTGSFQRILQGFFFLDTPGQGLIRRSGNDYIFQLTPFVNDDVYEFDIPSADAERILRLTGDEFGKNWFARIRELDGTQHVLTIKGPSETLDALARPEFEYSIGSKVGQALLPLCTPTHILKDRYPEAFGGHIWENDVFLGVHAPLIVHEVEIPTVTTDPARPDYVGREITGIKDYNNVRLAKTQKPPSLLS